MRVLVCGGRDFQDSVYLRRILSHLHEQIAFSLVIEGGALGADFMARSWAKANNIPYITFPADWNSYARHRAGPIRNHRMLREGKPDIVIGFPGGTGTAHMLLISRDAGVRVVNLAQHYRGQLGAMPKI